MQFALESTSESSPARIKVVGVGGAGGNAVNRMIEAGLRGVEFISINTDLQVLERNLAEVKIQIGSATTRGLGAGANPDRGRQSIEESQEIVAEKLKGADMVFITAGMGGGTGTGAAPVVAEIARELGILTVAVVTRPFDWEGMVRKRNARDGLAALRACVDTMIVIPNQKLLSVASKTMTMREAFRTADEVLHNAARGISEMILRPGEMNVDFADVSAIMRESGQALMGSGCATGEGRARIAAEQALHCPLLDAVDIRGARGMLVNITGGQILAHEINEVMEYFRAAVGEEGEENIIFGFGEDDTSDEFRVTLIATGFDPDMQNLPQTNGMPAYAPPQAPQQTWRPAAPPPAQPAYQAPQPTYQAPQAPAPVAQPATASWNAWQQQAPAEGTRAGTGSIAARGGAQRPSGQMPVAPVAPATTRGLRRDPSGSQVAVAPLSSRPRGIFVPDLEDDMDDDIEKPAYLRQRG